MEVGQGPNWGCSAKEQKHTTCVRAQAGVRVLGKSTVVASKFADKVSKEVFSNTSVCVLTGTLKYILIVFHYSILNQLD
jgi:hypothetical protein